MPDAQDARLRQDRADVGRAVRVGDIRAQLAAGTPGAEPAEYRARAMLRSAYASDSHRVDRPSLVLAGVPDHQDYCQLLRESLPKSRVCTKSPCSAPKVSGLRVGAILHLKPVLHRKLRADAP